MEKSNVLLQPVKSNNVEASQEGIGSKLSKSFISIIIIMVLCVTLLSSCFFGYRHGGGGGRHEGYEHHEGHGEHH